MIIFCVCLLLLPVCFSHPLAGWVSSPGYPGGYEPHSEMFWERCAPAGHKLSLTMIHLDLEDSFQCENDAVKVFADGLLLLNLCGRISADQLKTSVNPSLLSSPGGCLSLSFQADYSNTERHTGFTAFYTAQDVDECWDSDLQCSHFCQNYIGGYSCTCRPGYFLSQDKHTCTANCTEERSGEGVLTPPGSPGPYFENSDCLYTVSVEEGKQLTLTFTGEFDVESKTDGQCVDSLTIKTESATFGPFCGQKAPSTIYTGARWVQILFRTDQGGTNQGFSLTYQSKAMECPGIVMGDSVQSPQKSVYTVGDKVTVRCVTGYSLSNSAEETFESTCQKNGTWIPFYKCEPKNCGFPELSDEDLETITEDNPLTTYKQNISFMCASKFYRMAGNNTFTCNANGYWESNGHIISTKADLPKCIPVCGLNNEIISAGRIFGGKKASLREIPWQLLKSVGVRGGASLISDRWALTAAHVVDEEATNTLVFKGGMIDGQDKDAVEMESEKIIIHPGYKRVVGGEKQTSYDNDIALVKMSARVPLSLKLRPVCLPDKTNKPVTGGNTGTVSGFGLHKQRAVSRFLQYAHLREYSNVPCFETSLTVTDNMICAGEEFTDSCKGDSGGPYFFPRLDMAPPETQFQLRGIVSWGPPTCGDKNFKGYYTKVENYLDWIRETMEKN